MIPMPNKAYVLLYNGSVLLTFKFYNQDKPLNTIVNIGSKVIVNYYENDILEQTYGVIKGFNLDNSQKGNSKLIIVIDGDIINFNSMVSLNIIESNRNRSPQDIGNIEDLTIKSLKDLILMDIDDLYSSLNAEEAFKEIALRIKNYHIHLNEEILDKIINTGDGTKYLSDDGTYKQIIPDDESDDNLIDDTNLSSAITTLSSYMIMSQINSKISELIGSSPDLLNTLNELASALGNDPNFATTILAALGDKVDKSAGMGLTSNDYINEDKLKVNTIDINGDGSTFLSSDGTYKQVIGGGTGGNSIDDTNLSSVITTLSSYMIMSQISSKISELVNSSPDTLNTLNELASALGNDPNFAATILTALGNKVDKAYGMGLSANNLTNELKAKLNLIINTGDGSMFLSNNGIYKKASSINDTELLSTESTLSAYQIILQINSKISELVNSSPDTLNTLNEISIALGNDPNFTTTILTVIGTKVDKVDGMGLSSNDFSNTYKEKADIITKTGDGSTFLSSDGTYKQVIGGGDGTIYTDLEIIDMVNAVWGVA